MAKRGVVGIPNIIKFEKFSIIILRKFSNLGKLIGWVDGYFRNSRFEGCKGVGRFNIFRKWIPEAYTARKERLEMSFYIRLRNKIVVRTPWSTKWNLEWGLPGGHRRCCSEFWITWEVWGWLFFPGGEANPGNPCSFLCFHVLMYNCQLQTWQLSCLIFLVY